MAEQDAMMYVDQHIVMSAVLGDGSASIFGVIGRFLMRLKVLSRVNLCLVVCIPIQGLYRKKSRFQRQALAK